MPLFLATFERHGVDGARRLYEYAESHSGDSRFADALQQALSAERIAWLMSSLPAPPAPQPAAAKGGQGQLNQLLGTFLNTRLSLRARIIRELGQGHPVRWTSVAIELTGRGFGNRITAESIENTKAYHLTGPQQAEAFLTAFCQLLNSTVGIFADALDTDGLSALANDIRQAAQ